MYLFGYVYSIYEQPAFYLDTRRCYTNRPPAKTGGPLILQVHSPLSPNAVPCPCRFQRRIQPPWHAHFDKGRGLLPRRLRITFGRSFNCFVGFIISLSKFLIISYQKVFSLATNDSVNLLDRIPTVVTIFVFLLIVVRVNHPSLRI